jgi:lactose/L-arabinose transport system ATP-binding protein
MRLEITRLHQRLGATMIYVTHDQVEAMTLADRIVVLRAGVIEQVGTPIELYDNPDNTFVAGFIGSPRMNFIEAVVDRIEGRQALVRLPRFGDVAVPVATRNGTARPGEGLQLGIRPEHFVDAASAPASLRATANVVEQLGGFSYVYASSGPAEITVQQKGHSAIPSGAEVSFGLDPAACLLFDGEGKRV